ncbi:regulator of nonsense transcripts 3A-like isoform X2 [Amblyraja radiata]|uniref:regulator of nonsense transcripts 3A-like isoform X2 n=1 Tax=Amblyraja radiata TaxID=386614 RepID=UPI0014029C15|nr:regulator of nonsense transcripts 3A-like isoform X2 [Amblyraja radiata]XP_055493044.1 regulator of nonsense transcripts 3A isoform X4 [Leucoraja erinacea]
MKEEKENKGRERRVEIQFREREEGEKRKEKDEKKEVLTKVVIRRLPPNLTKTQLEEQLHPLPTHDYFEFCAADVSLYPHLFSRAYINFKNPDDIILFRDRFDGYIFIDNKGQEYPAVVEFAPFQKISKRKLKKKDTKSGSIEEDPEYKKFLESYCADEEKVAANPETLLGEIEAKTRELIARRTTPLLEYIKNKKLEKQRIREEKREERRRRELEKKRLREEEKRKRREEERRKRKEAEKQKKIAEKERKEEIKIKLLKKADKEEEQDLDKWKEKAEDGEIDKGKWEKPCCPGKRSDNTQKDVKDKPPNDSDRERRERERERRLREKERERERQRRREDDRRKQKERYDVERAFRTKEDETKRGKEHGQEREKKGDSLNYMFSTEKIDKLGKEDKNDDMGSKRERIRNKDRPAMQLYQPGARCRTRLGSGGRAYDCCSKSSEDSTERKYEDDSSVGACSEKSCEE